MGGKRRRNNASTTKPPKMGFGDGEHITRTVDKGWASGTVSQTDKALTELENTGALDSQRQEGGVEGLRVASRRG